MMLDLSVDQQIYVEDCEVCCRPLEISYTAVSAYELGTREPDLLTLLQYARVAGISTDALIDDKLNV